MLASRALGAPKIWLPASRCVTTFLTLTPTCSIPLDKFDTREMVLAFPSNYTT